MDSDGGALKLEDTPRGLQSSPSAAQHWEVTTAANKKDGIIHLSTLIFQVYYGISHYILLGNFEFNDLTC